MTRDAAAGLATGTIVRHTPSGRLYQVQYVGADGRLVVRGQRGTGGGYNGPTYGVRPAECRLDEERSAASRAASALARLSRINPTEAQQGASRANGNKGGRPRTRPRCVACEAAGRSCRHKGAAA